jgi:hypothetical protein
VLPFDTQAVRSAGVSPKTALSVTALLHRALGHSFECRQSRGPVFQALEGRDRRLRMIRTVSSGVAAPAVGMHPCGVARALR